MSLPVTFDLKYLHEGIRDLRCELGLSQDEFAEKCLLTQGTISNLESGRTPTLETLNAIAKGLGGRLIICFEKKVGP
jgi:transcriptional regulator with XRE-family HTH domain